MADMFSYLQWRGDIPFSSMPVNDVDSLILSTLSYIHFDGIVAERTMDRITLRDASQTLLSMPDRESRVRVPMDLTLLEAAAQTQRFGEAELTFYHSVFDPEEETQFGAITFLLGDGSAFLSFRGTDNSLVGWKEDFNMSFCESVPAQQLALDYLLHFAVVCPRPLRLGGHSKGGNLAFYAAAKADSPIQDRVLAVSNHDGPGFSQKMLLDPGYRYILPYVRTFVPQSSVFGMLLEHEEPCTIIRSNSVGVLQHDPYTWEVLGKDFIAGESLTPDSRFLDQTIRTWLAGMTAQERSEFFDTLFSLLMAENASRPRDVLRPQNILSMLKALHIDDDRRNCLGNALGELLESVRNTHREMTGSQNLPPE